MEVINTFKQCLKDGFSINIEYRFILLVSDNAEVTINDRPGSFEILGVNPNQKFYSDLRLSEKPGRGNKIIQIRNLLFMGCKVTLGKNPVLTFADCEGYLRLAVSNSNFMKAWSQFKEENNGRDL